MTEVARTLARYCQRCDDGDWDAFEALFEPDATFTVMGATHQGAEKIRGFIESSMPPEVRGKHFLGQSDVEVDDAAGTATGVTDFVFINKEHVITTAGRYHDTLRRGDDGVWRFVSREIRFLGE